MKVDRQLIARVVEDAIPRISSVMRPDIADAVERAVTVETSARGQQVLDLVRENARIACDDHVPLCQDTGTVWVLLEAGEDVALCGDVFADVDAAVARAYQGAALRMSTLRDAHHDRTNPGDNTPAFCDVDFVAGTGAKLHIMLKGGGSDNASALFMLPPGAGVAGIEKAVVARVREKASSACPPLIVGIGVGSTFDHVGGLAKRALLRRVDDAGASADLETRAFEEHLLETINALGIGPAALGGDVTALAVRVETAPCHIAALPLAINLGCIATRTTTIDLETGEVLL